MGSSARPQMNPLAINPGELRHQVQIQKASSSNRDAAGQPVDAWDLVLETRAKIENTSSHSFRESFRDNALASQATDAVTIRWPGAAINIQTGMRVQFGDNYFLIQAVDNVLRRNRKVVLACIQISSDSN